MKQFQNNTRFLFIFLIAFTANHSWSQVDKAPILTINIVKAAKDSIIIKDFEANIIGKYDSKSGSQIKLYQDTKEGYYRLINGDYWYDFYLTPDFKLEVKYDIENEGVIFKGIGSPENEYLQDKLDLVVEYSGWDKWKLDEAAYLSQVDKLNFLLTNLLNQRKPEFTSNLARTEKFFIVFKRIERLCDYEGLHRYMTSDPEFKVSDKFPDIFEYFSYDNPKLLDVPNYIPVVEKYIQNELKTSRKASDSLKDYSLQKIQRIEKLIKNKAIKEILAIDIGLNELNRTTALDSVFLSIQKIASKHSRFPEVEKKYNQIQKVAPGKVAPQFTFKDESGESVSLSDFKGKLVYIDIWASWCTPCIKELPHLAEVKKSMEGKNIVFVNISQDNSDENWRAAIQKYKIDGINLISGSGQDPFFDAFDVQGIPRYILIDQEGMIIAPQAMRPSHDGLLEELESHL